MLCPGREGDRFLINEEAVDEEGSAGGGRGEPEFFGNIFCFFVDARKVF